MTNLRVFSAQYNSIFELSENLFKNSQNLEEFDISYNNFIFGPTVTNALNGLTNMRKLVLTHVFEFLDFNFFTQFQKLELLIYFPRNSAIGISWQSLPTSLRRLRFSRIGEEIPENAFQHLTNLTDLSFNGLGIHELQPNTFGALTRLLTLEISFTNIRSLHPQQFANQRSLHTLIITGNPIVEFPEGIFTPLVNLGTSDSEYGLEIYQNHIGKLDANSFGIHPHLKTISFKWNNISKIERGLFSRFPNLSTVDLSYNNCVSRFFYNVNNLDAEWSLEKCFVNWDDRTTDDAGQILKKFEVMILSMISVALLAALV